MICMRVRLGLVRMCEGFWLILVLLFILSVDWCLVG